MHLRITFSLSVSIVYFMETSGEFQIGYVLHDRVGNRAGKKWRTNILPTACKQLAKIGRRQIFLKIDKQNQAAARFDYPIPNFAT